MTSSGSRHAGQVALALACVTAVFAYAALRAGQVLLTDEPRPLDVLLSEHSGYVWRVVAATLAGALAAPPAYVLAVRAPSATARALLVAVPGAALALALQAALAP